MSTQLVELLGSVEVRLIADQEERLLGGCELGKGRELSGVQIGVGDEEYQVGPGGRFLGHDGSRCTVDLVEARRIDEDDLRIGQSRHAVTGPFPIEVPHILGPATADVRVGHGIADEGVDQRALAGADLAENDDLDPAPLELLNQPMELIDVPRELLSLVVGAAVELLDGLANRKQRGVVGVGCVWGFRVQGLGSWVRV